ncbi:RNA-binding protein [Aquabacter cavernae]|uniref:RNA-binding protein n=1 Tax=Aquabacter cavernae TaxID=2496029 RepID=UPI000F8E283B|nr:RNA-binding protein [Aquabacter cavernae]
MLSELNEEETDAGPRGLTSARAPLARLCLATREVTPVEEMIRYVVAPDGAIVPDLARNLPGRGAWVTATRAALETALKRRAFGRAFRGKGQSSEGLPDLVEARLLADARAALSLANKAGRVVTGTVKVEVALQSETVGVLVHAADARPDGVRKLDGAARRAATADPQAEDSVRMVAVVDCLTGVELDLALGRSNVVHAALLAHPTTAGFLARCRRLERWRTGLSDGSRQPAGSRGVRMAGTETE